MEDTKRFPIVYVCTPSCTHGKVDEGTVERLDAWSDIELYVCRKLMQLGYVPFSPKLYFNLAAKGFETEGWKVDYYKFSKKCLMNADELWIIGDIFTDGMIEDIAMAKTFGIPVRHMVFTSLLNFLEVPIGDMSAWRVISGQTR